MDTIISARPVRHTPFLLLGRRCAGRGTARRERVHGHDDGDREPVRQAEGLAGDDEAGHPPAVTGFTLPRGAVASQSARPRDWRRMTRPVSAAKTGFTLMNTP